MKATQVAHWPGKSTPACDIHAAKIHRLAVAMGMSVTCTPCEDDAECENCKNENKLADPSTGFDFTEEA